MKPSEYKYLSLKFVKLVFGSRTCPFCKGSKAGKMYVCLQCWHRFPPATKKALSMADSYAPARLMGLVEHAAKGSKPALVQISKRRQARYGPYDADKIYKSSIIQSIIALFEN